LLIIDSILKAKMEKLKFTFSVKAHVENPKSNVIVLTSIITQENKCYAMRVQYQQMEYHKELTATTAFKQKTNDIEKRGQTRRMWIMLLEAILKLYPDKEGNMVFKNYVLEELPMETPATTEGQETPSINLSEETLTRILEKFVTKQDNGYSKNHNLKKLSEKICIREILK